MKNIFLVCLSCILTLSAINSCAQKPSPPATVTQKVGETTITINYSQPSVKGRTIGVDLEPMDGKVWRAGANDATVFEIDKDIMLEGKVLPKGKYGFFILVNGDTWTLIFNNTWKQWGAFKYKDADDALRVVVKDNKAETATEKLTYTISPDGVISVLWGNHTINFSAKEKH